MEKYNVSGMSCAACSARVQKAVSSLDGVLECNVNLLTCSMNVEGDVAPEAVIHAVEAAGYGASLASAPEAPKRSSEGSHTRTIILRLCFSCVLLTALMYISMGHVMWGAPLPAFFKQRPMAIALAELLLSGTVLVINRHFFISGFSGIMHLAPNMDTLVSLGSGVSYLYSVYLTFAIAGTSSDMAHELLHGLYFESAAMILTLITVGKLLEAYSKGKTTNALLSLVKLVPKQAIVLRDGAETTVAADQVHIGDKFIVKAGMSFPADGTVLDGTAAVDESALTGESIPSDKEAGSSVYAATVNRNGYLVCEATGVGEDTALSKIIQMVSDASATKAPIARLADKVSGIFVPFVMAIAVLTCAIWLLFGESVGFSLARGISVLVISCPCALGLATPVAIMVGSGRGALEGILYKNASALEQAGKTKIAAIDKTGTLTLGVPELTDIIPVADITREELLRFAYTLERKSEHPLACAIVTYAREHGIDHGECSELEILAGSGLCAKQGDRALHGGNLKYIKTVARVDQSTQDIADKLAHQGKTPLFFAEGETLLGIIAVADRIRNESKAAVGELKRMGICVVMLTGDNEKTAHAVAEKLGIERVIAGLLPGEKEAAIRSLSAEGKTVMVGDGINDAPALARADIGIAIGAGTQIAIDSADIVLVNSSPMDIAAAIKLSRKTLINIKQNLFWAFFYNAIGIPLAAGAFVPLLGWELDPMFGAAAMSLSSFCVVTNALRLNLVRLKDKANLPKQPSNEIAPPKEKASKQLELTIHIDGMMCPHCERAVKGALEAIDEVEDAIADHTQGTARVRLRTSVDNSVLIHAIVSKGYDVKSID